MFKAVIAISTGASLGALSRWGLGLALNAIFPPVPMGTLAANLAGGYLVGLAVGVFACSPAIAPEWRLFVVTGFLGSLTTFSAFSAEVADLLSQGRVALAAGAAGLHIFGSVGMTFLGLATSALLRQYRA